MLPNSLKLSFDFLISVCRLLSTTVDVAGVMESLRELVAMLETKGPREPKYEAVYEQLRERIDETLITASVFLTHPQVPAPFEPEAGLFEGFDVMEAGQLWQNLFQNTLDGSGA